jgi:plastocyanin domain-containing protein
MDGDRQIVEITAKGGYLPRMSTVKAGVPTVLRFNTKGTFDCSSSVRIPSLNISQVLPASGSTDIALGALVEGVLKGTCGMGMYPFELNVQS